MKNPILALEEINIEVRNRSILKIANFELQAGELLGVMGPNGAGKSTLLKTLALLELPTKGIIKFQNKPINANSALEVRRKFAVALQQSLLLDMSVYQNVALGLKIRNRSRREIKEKVSYWLEVFKISHLAKKHAYHLSGGEAQRVNLARAMILQPEILFLDEPFSALDFPTKVQLLKDIKNVVEQTSTTTVFISHDLMEIKYFTNTLAILIDGEIKQYGPTDEVLSFPNRSSATFIGEWNQLLS
ncbi:ATP-binding cassette domain-containing protein [Mesobacillus maritimus]|uniref:ATP-binding cassette domain-containing protein n=1 Tax=Mesobacillus maritimus TaxID=1643336 RepID=UPI00203CB845|nr:ATP-binding cassette domain-containing protein [Mesobacillus maritimus]MCM3585097.1 ATP-binding cassette domain-containing protein [Mesobacillus maritimus]MCM3670319.1 ATP-binding cassette domain-containing protein [Mesobacillus maritimus]